MSEPVTRHEGGDTDPPHGVDPKYRGPSSRSGCSGSPRDDDRCGEAAPAAVVGSPGLTPSRLHTRRVAAGVLVIGTGAAGVRAAIELAERGLQALCVGKRRRDDAHTVLPSGGINAALGMMDPEDSWEQHAADTLREGYWLGDPRSVELLCREAPDAIDDLVRWGAQFAREADGRLS